MTGWLLDTNILSELRRPIEHRKRLRKRARHGLEAQEAGAGTEGMQSPSEELNLANQFGYLPAREAVAKEFVKAAGPEWSDLATQTLYAHPRTLGLGTKYNTISTAVWDAISAVSATPTSAEVTSALTTAQAAITAALGK